MKAFERVDVRSDGATVHFRKWSGGIGTIEVTRDEARAILDWASGGALLHNALPHWDGSKRELLLSGMSDEDWTDIFGEDD